MKPTNWRTAVRIPVIVLAGGAHGNRVEQYRYRWPKARYILFEPAPFYHPVLERFADDPLVTVIHKALSDRRGEADFYVNRLPRTSSLYAPNAEDVWGRKLGVSERIEVECETLDLFCAEQDIPRIGFIELDAQGGELGILRGASGLLEKQAIDCLMIEMFYTEVYRGIPMMGKVDAFLREKGYVCAGALPQRPAADGIRRWNDRIYHRKGQT